MPPVRPRSRPDDAALLDDVVAVDQTGHLAEILVDDHDGLTGLFQFVQAAPDLGADQRGKALRRLVQHQQARIRHQGPADRQHLLLPAREGAGRLASPLAQTRKQRDDTVERPAAGATVTRAGGGDEIFFDGERRKDPPPFRHQAEAQTGDGMRRQARERLPLEVDPAAARPVEAHDGAHRRRLAHAVAADQRHHFAGPRRHGQAEQHPAAPVAGLDSVERQHQCASPR